MKRKPNNTQHNEYKKSSTGHVVYNCNPYNGKVEVGRLRLQVHPWIES